MITTMEVTVCQCEVCGHGWHPKPDTIPARCARCKSPAWNRDKLKPGRPARPRALDPDKVTLPHPHFATKPGALDSAGRTSLKPLPNPRRSRAKR